MENKKTPQIRFKGYSEEWKEKRLGEIGNTYSGLSGKTKDDFGKGNAKYITYLNVFSNPIANTKQLEFIEIDNTQNQVQNGDVLFTTSSETPEEVGMSSIWLNDIDNIYLNSFCFGYRLKEDLDKYYLAYLLRSTVVREKIVFLAQGISRYNISKNRVMDISISTPSLPEQTQIGEFFQHIDDLLNHHQQKHSQLQTLKKAMLEKMFPKEGSDTPEIRFKGFQGKWEKKRLGEVADIIGGGTPSTFISEYWNGEIDWYSPTEIGNKIYANGSIKKITQLGFKNSSAIMLPANKTVLFSSRAGIGDMAILTKDGCTNQGFQSFILKEEVNVYFLYSYGFKIKKQALINASGSTFLEISGKQLSKIELYFPRTLAEQTQIGNYFQELDNLITLQQQQIDKLQQIKKALLDRMFV